MGYRYVAAFESIKNHEFSSLSISLIALVERLYCRRNNSEASMTKIRRRIHKVHERASVKSPSFLSRFPRRPNKFLSLASNRFPTIIDYGDSEKERENFARVAKKRTRDYENKNTRPVHSLLFSSPCFCRTGNRDANCGENVSHCRRAISVRASMTVNEKGRETNVYIRIYSRLDSSHSPFLIINSAVSFISSITIFLSFFPFDRGEISRRDHDFSFLPLFFHPEISTRFYASAS